ncbi:radical SAM protein [Marinobacterium aestuariivivens]|uniref:Radical SAM protein n=1 Tax=Marinobacterium aestuariivivens TaxID=1698799 RepID=A0ABW2A7W6_9GAMM
MKLIRSRNWYSTPQGEPRGYIRPHALRELWFHTGTACNLSCPFCLEGSKPGDNRLQILRLEDVEPFLLEARALGVEQLSFTGGEPFVAKDLIRILCRASDIAPCLVLTNGTEALQQRAAQLQQLRGGRHPVSFRVSIDHPEREAHDAGRGEGSFDSALAGLQLLDGRGFHVSVARQMKPDEDRAAVEARYRALMREKGLPVDIRLVAFPDFLPPGSEASVPAVTTHCMTAYQTEESRRAFMCAFSKMVVKQNGRMRVYACTLVDDDPEYDLGATLREAMEQQISMKHHRCFSCFRYGASCSEV